MEGKIRIVWADITPLSSPPAAQGAMGVVVPATHKGRKVAVKVFKSALLAAGELERATGMLQDEITKMTRASDGGLNEFVALPVGVVVGDAPPPWLAALGTFLPACVTPPSHLRALVMKWEEGGTLAELLHAPTRAWGAGTGGRLQLCAQLASGVAALHAAGVIHGDVKGENVLLSDRGASPKPRFTDFGFAELRTAASSASRVSSAIGEKRGTWPYMAPEMLTDEEGVSRSGDVYALGTLCWEVLTGAVPWEGFTDRKRMAALFKGADTTATLLLSSPPLPVDTPAAVKELLGACLATAKAARPRASQAAGALHQAVQDMASGTFHIFLSHAWVDGKHAPLTTEVYLRLIDAGYRVWLDTAEMGHDMVASMEGGIAKSGCVVALLSERYGARPNCLLELRAARDAGKPVVACLADAAPGWFPAADSEVAALVGTSQHLMPDLRAAAAVGWRADVPAAERGLLTKAPTALPKVLQLVKEVLGRDGPSSPAATTPEVEPTSPHGCGSGAPPPALPPPPLAPPAPPLPAPRAMNGRCVAKLRHGDVDVGALAVVEGVGLVSGGTAHIRAWAQGADRGLASFAGAAEGIAALPGGRFAAAGGDTLLVEVWSAGTGQRIHQLRGHTECVNCVAALPGGHLASGSKDKTVRVWDAATGAPLATLEGHTNAVSALAALPDGRLASGSWDSTVRIWNMATRACTYALQHPDYVRALTALDGDLLASGCDDKSIHIWSPSNGVKEAVLKGHTQYVHSLAALPSGLLASGDDDNTVRVWDLAARACVAVLEEHGGWVVALAALPDGRLASGSFNDPLIRVWALTAPGSPEDAAATAAARACVEVAPAACVEVAPAPMVPSPSASLRQGYYKFNIIGDPHTFWDTAGPHANLRSMFRSTHVEGTRVLAWGSNGGLNQQFLFRAAPSAGCYYLSPRCCDGCDVFVGANGDRLCLVKSPVEWRIDRAMEDTDFKIAFTLSLADGRVVEACKVGSADQGFRVRPQNKEGRSRQIFQYSPVEAKGPTNYMQKLETGLYHVTCSKDGNAWDTPLLYHHHSGGKAAAATSIFIIPLADGREHQMFHINAEGDAASGGRGGSEGSTIVTIQPYCCRTRDVPLYIGIKDGSVLLVEKPYLWTAEKVLGFPARFRLRDNATANYIEVPRTWVTATTSKLSINAASKTRRQVFDFVACETV